jgi:hypothetical protein
MSKTTKQTGYRVKIAIFIPCNHGDTSSVKNAVDYIDILGDLSLSDKAPKGTVVESFTSALAKRDAG